MKQVTSSIRFENIFRIFIFSFTCFLSILTDVHGAQLIQDCRSGGKGTLQECQQRDAKTAQKATQTTSPQCWLLPGGGSISAHSNSTPPITGARLGKCPNSETKSITAKQAQPSNTKTIEKNIDCRSGGRGTAQECQQRDAQAQAQAQSKARAAEKTFDCRSGGRGTAQECQQRDAQTQAQSKASTAEKTFDCRSGGRGTAQECQQRDAQADAKTKALNAEKRIDCRSGGRGTSQECQLRDAQALAQDRAQTQTNTRPTEKTYDCRSGGRGTAQECLQRDARAKENEPSKSLSNNLSVEKTFDCRSGGRGTAQECQQRDTQAQAQSNARAAEKIYDCRSGGRGTAQECQKRDAQAQSQAQTQTNNRPVEKIFDCRSGGRGTAQECQQRDAQEQGQSNARTAEKTFDCRSGGRGTAKECVERDNLATQRAPQTASQQCWLFPNGGNTIAHANSTPPVSGARLGKCPINETMPIQAAQSQPSTRTAEKIYDCRSGGRGTAKECVERDNLATQRASHTVSQQCWLFPNGGNTLAHANSTPPVAGARLGACPFNKQIATQTAQTTPQLDNQTTVKTYDCRSGGRGTAQECQQRDREAQEQISNRSNEKTYACNSGGRGTAKECIERDKLEGQIPIQSNSQKCWLLPDGGTIVAHPNSTPPVSGARLSSCPSSEKMTPRVNKSINNPIESPQQILAPTKPFSAETTKTAQLDSRWHGKWDALTVQVNGDISNSDKTNFIWISQRNKLPKRKGCWAFYDGSTTKSELEKSNRIAGTSIEEKKDIKDTIASLSNNQFLNVSLACTDISGGEEPMGDCIKSFFYDKDSIFQKSFCQLDSKISFHISRLKRLNTIQTTISNRPNTQSTFFHPLETGKNTKIVDGAGFFDPSYLKTEDRQHLGSDLRAKGGAKVFAMKNGTVAFYCGYNQNDPMQKAVVVQNDDKTTTVYGHINPLSNEVIKIKAGDLIGHVLEYSTSYPEFTPHLHLGETDNLKINCASRLKSNGKWGWGRAPKDSNKEAATEEGWIDAAKKYGYVAISN